MLDITNYKSSVNLYGGSEVKKTYYINDKKYMVKFPDPVREKNKSLSYVNNQYSEYIGCKIFELFNIYVQKTELVKCNINGKEKIGVACQDFLSSGEALQEFKTLSYSLDGDKKYTNDCLDIFEMITALDNLKDKDNFKNYFYEVFVVDTLIGNIDRHLGNWGLIVKDNKYRFSPIYDCGSALHPLISIENMKNLLNNSSELKNVSINLKTAYKYNGKSMTYIDFYELMPEELKNALIKMYPLINMDKIKDVINGIDVLSDTQKEFYIKTIMFRKEYILDKYYKKVSNS